MISPNSVVPLVPTFRIIQGGMGVAVSGWYLARTVSQLGQLGVVSGTGLTALLTRKLQDGDIGGHLRRAFAHFPIPDMAQRALDRYFIAGGKAPDAPYRLSPMPQIPLNSAFNELTVLGNFAEVFLAKEGHSGAIGINFLEKIQIPTLPSIFGAMLAGVDYVLMGAGIPRFIPGILDALAQGKPVELKIDVSGARSGESFPSHFDPTAFCGMPAPLLQRPKFLAIVSSSVLALTLAKKSSGYVDGFIIEGSTAGGHNAPPRGPLQLTERGEPLYGPRDLLIDLAPFREMERPFWMAGGYGHTDRLAHALSEGAAGIQVGTAFAYCDESGLTPELKAKVLAKSRSGRLGVFTDPRASPTGFPFKVVQMEETLSDAEVYQSRTRVCNLGYLRQPYRRDDGSVGYRCASEPIKNYLAKGGSEADTVGRKCICNALFGAIGLGIPTKSGEAELPLLTAGDDVAEVAKYLAPGRSHYSAADVIKQILGT